MTGGLFLLSCTSHNIVVRTTDSGNLSFDQTLTINVNNDDGAVSIDDVTITEGDNGITNAVFTVTFSEPVNNTITVDYSTADGTATVADNDYVPISPTPLVFNPNQTTQQITVEVNGDNLRENDETFFVNLTNLQANGSGITLGDDQGVGTINDDDNSAPTGISFINGFVLNGIDIGDFSGRSVSGAGDVNGDGFDLRLKKSDFCETMA